MTTIQTVILITAAILTLYAMKKGVNLGLIMLADTVFIALITNMSLKNSLKYAFQGAFSEKTISLVLLLFLIMMMENIMRTTGMIKGMVGSLKELAGSNRVAAGFLPAVLGLLPSPGGARFSCPMVEEVAGNNSDASNKAFVNYWFRHIWMDGFILYPGFILAAQLVGVSVITLFMRMLPFILGNVLLGTVFGVLFIKKEKIKSGRNKAESLKEFILSMLPIIILITLYTTLLKVTPYALEISSAVVVSALLAIKKYSFSKILTTMRDAFPVKLVLIFVGVMVFKEVLFGSGVVNNLPGLMDAWRIPPVLLFMLLPFLAGFATGITINFVSMTFPLLIPLGLGHNLWYAIMAFVSGSVGAMMTPLHLCAVMSADYFKMPLGKLLLKVGYAECILLSVIVGLYYIIPA